MMITKRDYSKKDAVPYLAGFVGGLLASSFFHCMVTMNNPLFLWKTTPPPTPPNPNPRVVEKENGKSINK